MRLRWILPAACTVLLAAPASAMAEDPPFLDWSSLLPGFTTQYVPNSENACVSGRVGCVDATVREMTRRFDPLASSCSHNAIFSLLYLRTTEEYRRAVEDPNYFQDNNFVNHEDAVFAKYYFDAYDAYKNGDMAHVPGAWKIAFDAAKNRQVTAAGNMLLGVNAHVNRDLPYVLAGIGLVKPDGSSRKPDHDKVNQILNRIYDNAIAEIAQRFDPTVDDTNIPVTTLDDMVLFHAIPAWRESAWRFAERLASASSDAQRAQVSQEIEANANLQATLLKTSQRYVWPLQSSASRDAYCATHHG
jgi:hypothetical protein